MQQVQPRCAVLLRDLQPGKTKLGLAALLKKKTRGGTNKTQKKASGENIPKPDQTTNDRKKQADEQTKEKTDRQRNDEDRQNKKKRAETVEAEMKSAKNFGETKDQKAEIDSLIWQEGVFDFIVSCFLFVLCYVFLLLALFFCVRFFLCGLGMCALVVLLSTCVGAP